MMTDCSPGPWKLEARPSAVSLGPLQIVVDANGDGVAIPFVAGGCGKANSNMLGAAFDMLTALKDVERRIRHDADFPDDQRQLIRAAIAKAEGRV